jgi:hypothetical protein
MHTSYIELQEVTILPIIALNGVTRLTKVFEFNFFYLILRNRRGYINTKTPTQSTGQQDMHSFRCGELIGGIYI